MLTTDKPIGFQKPKTNIKHITEAWSHYPSKINALLLKQTQVHSHNYTRTPQHEHACVQSVRAYHENKSKKMALVMFTFSSTRRVSRWITHLDSLVKVDGFAKSKIKAFSRHEQNWKQAWWFVVQTIDVSQRNNEISKHEQTIPPSTH